ncbi:MULTISPECIES: TrmH family RNA methyltransferase [Actinoalloteichus]|nr:MULTISPECIES: RNA methyltransferase [Actinoalloteichus]
MTEIISSASNQLVKRVRALGDRRRRQREGAFVVEGIQPVWRAVAAGWPIETLLVAPDLLRESAASAMVAEQEARGVRVARLSKELFQRLSDRDSPPGLAAIVRGRTSELKTLEVTPGAVFAVLHEVGNPGNLGTIIRTVDAVGGAGVILVGDCTDPFAPAAVKASMGSLFAVDVAHVRTADGFFDWVREHGVQVVTTSGRADDEHWSTEYRTPIAILLGSEGDGLPEDLIDRGDHCVRIPMVGTAESLNLAVAAGVLLYEARRHLVGSAE